MLTRNHPGTALVINLVITCPCTVVCSAYAILCCNVYIIRCGIQGTAQQDIASSFDDEHPEGLHVIVTCRSHALPLFAAEQAVQTVAHLQPAVFCVGGCWQKLPCGEGPAPPPPTSCTGFGCCKKHRTRNTRRGWWPRRHGRGWFRLFRLAHRGRASCVSFRKFTAVAEGVPTGAICPAACPRLDLTLNNHPLWALQTRSRASPCGTRSMLHPRQGERC